MAVNLDVGRRRSWCAFVWAAHAPLFRRELIGFENDGDASRRLVKNPLATLIVHFKSSSAFHINYHRLS